MFLEHINMTVADLDRSIDFYSRLLGWKVRWRGETSSGMPAAHIGDDRCYFALFEAKDATPAPTQKSYDFVGLNHFGLVVDDLDSIKLLLDELGIKSTSEQTYDPGRHLYFHDPDGVEIELVQYQENENPIPLASGVS